MTTIKFCNQLLLNHIVSIYIINFTSCNQVNMRFLKSLDFTVRDIISRIRYQKKS